VYTGGAFVKRGSESWRRDFLKPEEVAGKRADAKSLNAKFTEGEVQGVIESLKKKNAADANGFTAELLQAGVKELAPPITRLFNQMWASGEFPISEWNEGLLVLVFKNWGTPMIVQTIGP
jgi:hypothetical protein